MTFINFNGKIIPANQPCFKHNDRGICLGHGLFETILVNKDTLPALDYHWKRFEKSAPVIGISIPFRKTELISMIFHLIEKNGLQNKIAGVRLTFTHGESERGILPSVTPKPNFTISVFTYKPALLNPYSAMVGTTRKNEHTAIANIKSTNYLDNILAKQEALNHGYHEAIMLNTSANVADGSISNIFMALDGQIFTPPLSDGALPGVIRSILLEKMSSLFPIFEKTIDVSDLLSADEVFMTNALMGIQPLTKLNKKPLHSFPLSIKIRNEFNDHMNYL